MPSRFGGFEAISILCLAVCSVFYAVILLIHFLHGGKSPMVKPGCPDKCGNVSVPFPFGLKEGCYLNSRSKGFFLNCSHNETLFFSPSYGSHHFRVSRIDADGDLHVYTPVVKAYNNQIISKSTITSPEFPFSTFNSFTVVGCDTVGNITISGHSFLCSTVCTSDETDLSSECLGIGCCQTRMITGVWNYTIQLRRTRNHTKMGGKEYPGSSAFLADKYSYKFMKSDLRNIENRDGSPIITINWAVKKVDSESCVEARSDDSYACKAKHASCYQTQNPIGYRCHCSSIFVVGNLHLVGNPYLAGGCSSGILMDAEGFSVVLAVISCPCTLVILVINYRREKKRELNKRKDMLFRKNGGHLLKGSLTRFQGVINPIRIFTENEMEKATDKFDDKNIIGHGGFGTVYKGYLPELGTLAIKKSNAMNQSEIEIECFINEVMLLSKIHNQNVVTFLGCCLEMDAPLLIFELVSNGTLKSHLHNGTNQLIMPWATRLKVAAQIAGTLTYLHNNHCPPIIHRDVKPDNVLLDESFNAKVSDFGLSRLVPQNESRIQTGVKGTPGYLDPEYFRTLELTEKSDVYSFGVLLVELITRKKLGSDEGSILVYKFGSLMEDNTVDEIIDQDIVNDENVGQIMEVAQVANLCVKEKGEDRPTMYEVAVRLKSLWAEVEHRQSQDAHSARSNSIGSHNLSMCLSGGR